MTDSNTIDTCWACGQPMPGPHEQDEDMDYTEYEAYLREAQELELADLYNDDVRLEREGLL